MTLRLLPDAPRPARRIVRNAAGQEALEADLRLVRRAVLLAALVGAGLAIGIHFDDIKLRIFRAAFAGGEMRPVWEWLL